MSVLLLDAQYQAVKIISTRRACVLLLNGDAEPVCDDIVAEFRSQRLWLEIPAVVRLDRLVKFASVTTPPWSKSGVLARDHYVCQFVTTTKAGHRMRCNERATTVDHVHPKAKGGANSWSNCVAACSGHNSFKGDRSLHELGWSLKSEPFAPKRSVHSMDTTKVPESWLPYLTHS